MDVPTFITCYHFKASLKTSEAAVLLSSCGRHGDQKTLFSVFLGKQLCPSSVMVMMLFIISLSCSHTARGFGFAFNQSRYLKSECLFVSSFFVFWTRPLLKCPDHGNTPEGSDLNKVAAFGLTLQSESDVGIKKQG